MACYIVGQLRIADRETYQVYMKGFLKMFREFDGRVIAVDDSPTILEGEWNYDRFALIEFVDQAGAERWYRCDEYQAISRQFRWPSSDGPLLIVEGLKPGK